MKKILILLFVLTMSSSAQWVQITTVPTTQLNGVKFFDQFTGIAIGDNGIWRSTNSGIYWTQILATGRMNGISFYDINNGYVVGDSGKIYRTVNNGLNWSQQAQGLVTSNLNGVTFSTNLAWHVVGSSSTILRTLNASTWEYLSWGSDYYSVIMNSSGGGYAIGGLTREFIEKTANSGTNWTGVLSQTGNSCFDGAMLNSTGSNALFVESNGIIRKTNDYGLHWTFPVSNTTTNLKAITFPVVGSGYICGDNGVILKTTDNGDTWFTQNSGVSSNLKDVSFINSETGWVVGQNGIVLRTGIPVGIKKISSLMPNEFRVYQNYPNPFNPTTNVKFDNNANDVINISVYNIKGQKVETIFNQFIIPGTYEISWNGSSFASGVYYILVQNSNMHSSIKIILIK